MKLCRSEANAFFFLLILYLSTIIPPDKNIHSGGYWKSADKLKDLKNIDRRKGTYSKDFKERIGD